MLIKRSGKPHFTRRFPGMNSLSRRFILSGRDRVQVSVSEFYGEKGEQFDGVVYLVDETVRILSGVAQVTWKDAEGGTNAEHVFAGDTYHVPAGEEYSVEFISDVSAFCVFSPAANGTLPSSEMGLELEEYPGPGDKAA